MAKKKLTGRDRNRSTMHGDVNSWEPQKLVPAWISANQLKSTLPLSFEYEVSSGQPQVYLPFYVNNDGTTSPSNNTSSHTSYSVILELNSSDDSVGFSQEMYVLQEKWDTKPGDAATSKEINSGLSNSSELNKMFLVDGNSKPLETPKLVAGGRFTEATLVIEDAQAGLSVRLDNNDNVYVAYGELSEGSLEAWKPFALDGKYSTVNINNNDPERIRVGQQSIRFYTEAGSPTGITINAPERGEKIFPWDLSQRKYLTFWIYAENFKNVSLSPGTGGFQDSQPIVTLKTSNGSSFIYDPKKIDMVHDRWKQYVIELEGDRQWVRSTVGSPTLTDIVSLEIQLDTWEYGFTAYFDGIEFVSEDPTKVTPTGALPPRAIYAGGGNDQIISDNQNDNIFGEMGKDEIWGGTGIDILNGGSGNDTLYGDEGADVLDGMMGDDILWGDNETITEDDASNFPNSLKVEGNVLNGGSGNDMLRQGVKFYGGDGDDFLVTDGGVDILEGGTGSDRFDFYRTHSSYNYGSYDYYYPKPYYGVITDFDVTQDHIGIYVGAYEYSGFANIGLPVNAAIKPEQFRTGSEARDPDDRFIYDPTDEVLYDDRVRRFEGGTLYFDPDGNGEQPQRKLVGIARTAYLRTEKLFERNRGSVLLDYDDIITFDYGDRTPPPSRELSPLPSVQFSQASYQVKETDGSATLTLSRTGSLKGRSQVQVNITGGTATNGADYTTTSLITKFDIGESSQTITLPIIRDAAAEGTESVTLSIARYDDPTAGTVETEIGATNAATLQILNADGTGKDGGGTGSGGGGGTGRKGEVIGKRIVKGNKNDTLVGTLGNDVLISGKGNDKLTGSGGRDVFALQRGKGVDIIRDFKDKQDRLGLLDGITFKKLKVIPQGKDSLISLGKDELAVLKGVPAKLLSAADFTIGATQLEGIIG